MLAIITSVVGSLMGLSFLPQAYRIFKLKRSEEVSIFTYAFILFGALVWITYGVSVSDKVIVVANICGVIGAASVLSLTIYYRKNR